VKRCGEAAGPGGGIVSSANARTRIGLQVAVNLAKNASRDPRIPVYVCVCAVNVRVVYVLCVFVSVCAHTHVCGSKWVAGEVTSSARERKRGGRAAVTAASWGRS